MTSKWTPGPWQVASGGVVETKGGGSCIAWVRAKDSSGKPNHYPEPGSAEANARLIAAAPELADALRALVLSVETFAPEYAECDGWNGALISARATLAKIDA